MYVTEMAEWLDTMSSVKLGGFWSQFEASCVSSHTEELWCNETVCLWMTYIYIYIYIYIYMISSLCVYLCSCMHIMSILCSMTDAVSSGSWPILFKVLMLNVAICIVCLHFSSFCCLSSVADFSNTEARAPTSAGRAPFLPVWRARRFMYVVWVWVMVIFRWLFLFSSIEATLIDEQQ